MTYKINCIVWVALIFPSHIFAAEVRHMPTDRDDDLSLMTSSNCLTRNHPEGHTAACRTADDAPWEQYGLYTHVLLKSREDAFETSVRLLNQRLSRSTIERLFAKDDFLSFGSLVRLGAAFGTTRLEYIPLHVLAASRITNPSLPELQYSIAHSQVWRLAYIASFDDIGAGVKKIRLAAAGSYHESDIKRFSGNLVDLAAANIEEFSTQEKLSDAGLNMNARIEFAHEFAPEVGIELGQIGHERKASHHLEFAGLRGSDSRIEIGKNVYRWPLQIHAALAHAYDGLLSGYSNLNLEASLGLRLEQVELTSNYSAWARSFGFVFYGSGFRASVLYQNEKQANEIKLKRYDDLVVALAASL